MNPFESPIIDENSAHFRAPSNPAKPLLYVSGAFGMLQGLFAIPVGLFVGSHILGAAVAMLFFGSTAIWLGHRRYDRIGRYATISWGVLAILLILGAIALQPPTMKDVAEIAFITLALLVVGTVSVAAAFKRPCSDFFDPIQDVPR